MKKQFVALLMLMSICFARVFAQAVAPVSPLVPPPVLKTDVDYEGKALGKEIPEWVKGVAEGNYNAIKKALGINHDEMKIFVIMDRRSCKYSDYFYNYYCKEQLKINLKRELQESIIKRVLGLETTSTLETFEGDYSGLLNVCVMCSDFLCNMLVEAGFVSIDNTFWMKFERGNDSYYEFYAVWGINKHVWDTIIECFNAELEEKVSFVGIENLLLERILFIKNSTEDIIHAIMGEDGFSSNEYDAYFLYLDLTYNHLSLKDFSNEIKDPYLIELFSNLHDINFSNLEIIEYYINELYNYEYSINRAKGILD